MIEVKQHGAVAVLQIVHGKANALDIDLCEAISARFDADRIAALGLPPKPKIYGSPLKRWRVPRSM